MKDAQSTRAVTDVVERVRPSTAMRTTFNENKIDNSVCYTYVNEFHFMRERTTNYALFGSVGAAWFSSFTRSGFVA